MLKFETLTAWLDELDSNGTVGIGFGGGEPTLHPHFVGLCEHAAENTGMAVTFTTHGHHLTDNLMLALRGHVHFVRVSMDGVEATYEAIRGRSFNALAERVARLKELAPFGINYVVNAQTFLDLDAAIDFAERMGAAEMLLLPEQPVIGRGGIDLSTASGLRRWVREYRGRIRLAISERGAEDMPTCNPFAEESGLRAYAHIDAQGLLKSTSYDNSGVAIGPSGLIAALQALALRVTSNPT